MTACHIKPPNKSRVRFQKSQVLPYLPLGRLFRGWPVDQVRSDREHIVLFAPDNEWFRLIEGHASARDLLSMYTLAACATGLVPQSASWNVVHCIFVTSEAVRSRDASTSPTHQRVHTSTGHELGAIAFCSDPQGHWECSLLRLARNFGWTTSQANRSKSIHEINMQYMLILYEDMILELWICYVTFARSLRDTSLIWTPVAKALALRTLQGPDPLDPETLFGWEKNDRIGQAAYPASVSKGEHLILHLLQISKQKQTKRQASSAVTVYMRTHMFTFVYIRVYIIVCSEWFGEVKRKCLWWRFPRQCHHTLPGAKFVSLLLSKSTSVS